MTQQPPRGALLGQDAITVYASARIVPVWEETIARRRAAADGTPEAELWDEALARLVSALDDAEALAAQRCPPLGRRSWRGRSTRLGATAPPRIPRQRA